MRKILNDQELHLLSFPDIEVVSMSVNASEKKAYIETDRCWISELNRYYYNCKIEVKGWSDFSIKLFTPKTQSFEAVDLENLDPLREICEFEFGESIFFAGYGKKTVRWFEYEFLDAKMTVSVEEEAV